MPPVTRPRLGLLKKSPAFADEARIVAVVDVDLSDEAAGGADCCPSATAGGVILVVSLPREFCGGSVACAVADVEEAFERAEGYLAIRRAIRRLDAPPRPGRGSYYPSCPSRQCASSRRRLWRRRGSWPSADVHGVFRKPHQIIGGGREGEGPSDTVAIADLRLVPPGDRLDPPEHLLDTLADALADEIAATARCTSVNRRTSAADVLRHMRRQSPGISQRYRLSAVGRGSWRMSGGPTPRHRRRCRQTSGTDGRIPAAPSGAAPSGYTNPRSAGRCSAAYDVPADLSVDSAPVATGCPVGSG
jgi:hypothetical protein